MFLISVLLFVPTLVFFIVASSFLVQQEAVVNAGAFAGACLNHFCHFTAQLTAGNESGNAVDAAQKAVVATIEAREFWERRNVTAAGFASSSGLTSEGLDIELLATHVGELLELLEEAYNRSGSGSQAWSRVSSSRTTFQGFSRFNSHQSFITQSLTFHSHRSRRTTIGTGTIEFQNQTLWQLGFEFHDSLVDISTGICGHISNHSFRSSYRYKLR